MDLRQLEFFIAVAEEAQFTRAARRIPIAQSALSTSIRTLERELGAELFRRTTRRVELTPAGEALLPEARRTLAAAAAARASVEGVGGVVRGSVSVGGIATGRLFDQVEVLAEFRARHPDVAINYVRDASSALLERIAEGHLDVAFVGLPSPVPDDVHAIEIRRDTVVFVCRVDHPLAQRTEVSIQELADETFVSSTAGSIGFQLVSEVFASAGKPLSVPYQVNDVATILDFVSRGLGVSLVGETYARDREELCHVPIADITLAWTLALATSPPERQSPAAAAFAALVDEGVGRREPGP